MRVIGLVVAMWASAAWPCSAQSTVAAPGAAPPILTAAEMERFLLKADIKATIKVSKGVTKARQVRMSDGTLTHDAQVQDVDISMPIFQVDPKHTEVNFKDSYRYNIAAYRLALLLGLDNVPMSVERVVDHKPSAVTWWLDDVAMEEGDRKKLKSQPYGRNPVRTLGYLSVMRVFDELIQNRDRNQGNLLWTSDFTMWLIDHTRAFRLGKTLLKPEQLTRCDRGLLEKLRAITPESLAQAVGSSLTKQEQEALLARRDAIVKIYEERIAKYTEAAVLFTL